MDTLTKQITRTGYVDLHNSSLNPSVRTFAVKEYTWSDGDVCYCYRSDMTDSQGECREFSVPEHAVKQIRWSA